MQSRRLAAALLLTGLSVAAGTFAAAGPTKKAAIPDEASQAKITALIKELYADDLAKARTDSSVRARLAATFLQEARDTNDNLAGKYVLLRQARDLAGEAGDVPVAFQAIDELSQTFTLSSSAVFQMKVHALARGSSASATPEAYRTIIDSALALLDETVEADDYETSLSLAMTAEAAARKLRIVSLVSSVRKRADEVRRQQEVFAKWKPFAERLAKNPKDPEANAAVGSYYAFQKGNWEKGLVLLAQGNDKLLRSLAAAELAEPVTGAARVNLAEGWLQAAQRAGDTAKANILLRAYYWYQQAVPDLSEPQRLQIDKRMQAIMDELPREFRVGDIVAEVKRCDGHTGPVYSVAISPDGKKALSGGADGSVRLWDVKTGRELRRLHGHVGRVWTITFSPDGRRAASGGFDNTIRIWDLTSAREIRRLAGHADYVRSVAFSSDGKYLLSGGDDRLVRLWNVETAKEVRAFPGHDHFVWDVAISRDGKYGLSASLDKTIRLWDLQSGEGVKRFEGHKDTVLSVAFSAEGRRALSGSTDKTLRLWDVATGKEIQTFTGHTGYVHAVAFSPDGRRAISGSQDNTVRLWDVNTGEEIRKLEGHRDQVWSVAFSRDGRLALSGGQDTTVRIWGGR